MKYLILSLLLFSCAHKILHPPIAKKVEYVDSFHNDKRVDHYRWMHDSNNPEVKKHLHAELDYAHHINVKNKKLIDSLKKEFKKYRSPFSNSLSHISPKYFYYNKKKAEESHYIWYRKKGGSLDEEILFNENELAKGHEFFSTLGFETSPSEDRILLTVDYKGRGHAIPLLIDLKTKSLTELPFSLIWKGDIAWLSESTFLFFATREEKEPYHLYFYDIETKSQKLIHSFENKEAFRFFSRTTDRKYLLIGLSETTSTTHYLYEERTGRIALFEPRKNNVKNSFDHNDFGWFKKTNLKDPNFEIYQKKNKSWERIISPGQGDIQSMKLGKDYLVYRKNNEGIPSVHIRSLKTNKSFQYPLPSKILSIGGVDLGGNPEKLYIGHSSFVMPYETYVCEPHNCQPELYIPTSLEDKNFDRFEMKRIQITARDGKKIPVSLVYKKGIDEGKPRPFHIEAYGAYGAVMPPYFNRYLLPVLDRGVVYAFAHIRGGKIKGRKWYDDGRLLKKKNSFNDFIDVVEHFINSKQTTKDLVSIQGQSAGGLLMGAVLNQRPDLFRVATLIVPFVDVLNTMTLYYDPLAKYERKEWGDGLIKKEYEYIKSYDPYTNIEKKQYPSLLVKTGFEDTAVYYFQPMKWVAKMREINPENLSRPLLFFTTFKGGHGGDSDLDSIEKAKAEQVGFQLGELGIKN